MNMSRKTAGAVLGVTLFVGTLIGGGSGIFAQSPDVTPPAATSESEADQVQEPSYTGSTSVDEAQYEGVSEADEAAALQGQATISAEEAQAAAEAANPGTTATKVELDNENGVLVYSVELDNGLDVKVDAGDGSVLHTEQAGEDGKEEGSEGADDDDIQEENENEDDDDSQEPSYSSSITVDQAAYEGMNEADEAAALQDQATISAEEAQAAAEAAHLGSTATKVELDNENGSLVYSVELDNGLDVKVDAGDGTVLGADADND